MSKYVVVTADFHDIENDVREKIYKCLKEMNWHKITNIGRDIATVWWSFFPDTITYQDAIEISEDHFIKCSNKFKGGNPKMVIHAGSSKPTII